jgi:hypothetical protein
VSDERDESHLEEADIPGDDVPEYPGEGGGRHEYINSDDHRNIEDIDEGELAEYDLEEL